MAQNGIIEMPCLGRTFKPGSLYDCRTEMLVPAITLWNKDKLEKALDNIDHRSVSCETILDDTVTTKSNKLGVDASLKLSLLGGMLGSVEGSAHYLNDHRTSKKQARLSLKYSETSHYKELTMNHFGPRDIQYGEVFDNDKATHVVTKVLYGADAFFVFDYEADSEEQVHQVGGALKVALNFVLGEISGEAKLDVEMGNMVKQEKISIKFIGDLSVKTGPRNLAEAVQLYADLPALIKGNTVPKRVWLYPLAALDRRAAKLIRVISNNLVAQTEKLMLDLHEMEMEANDLVTSSKTFEGLNRQAVTFQKNLAKFKLHFQNRLLPVLPKIRGGGASESELVKILADVESSPFAPDLLKEWLKGKRVEVDRLNYSMEQITTELQGKITTEKDEVDRILNNYKNNYVIALTVNIGVKPDPYLEELEGYLKGKIKSSSYQVLSARRAELEKENWALVMSLRKTAITFIDYVNINYQKNNLKFVVCSKELADDDRSLIIRLHNLNKGTIEEFVQPPPPPGKPIAHFVRCVDPIRHNVLALQVNWIKPEVGLENVTYFELQYAKDSDWTNTSVKKWDNPDVPPLIEDVDLSPRWQVRMRSVCATDFGEVPGEFGEPSDPAPATMPTYEWVPILDGSPLPANAVLQTLKRGKWEREGFVVVWFNGAGRPLFGRGQFFWEDDKYHFLPSEECGQDHILTDSAVRKNPYCQVNPCEMRKTDCQYSLLRASGFPNLCAAVVNENDFGWKLGTADMARSHSWGSFLTLEKNFLEYEKSTWLLVRGGGEVPGKFVDPSDPAITLEWLTRSPVPAQASRPRARGFWGLQSRMNKDL